MSEFQKSNKNTSQEIDIEKIDLERMKTQITSIPSILEYAHDRSSAIINPTDEGKIKSVALRAMEAQTQREFDQIIAQMKPLVDQMEKLKKRIYISETIYTAKIPFEPQIGQIYYLYKKSDGSSLLSIIAPAEWGTSMPYDSFEAKIKLLPDHTWEVVEDRGE